MNFFKVSIPTPQELLDTRAERIAAEIHTLRSAAISVLQYNYHKYCSYVHLYVDSFPSDVVAAVAADLARNGWHAGETVKDDGSRLLIISAKSLTEETLVERRGGHPQHLLNLEQRIDNT